MPALAPKWTILLGLTWLLLTSGLHALALYGLTGYEDQLRRDLNVTILPEPDAVEQDTQSFQTIGKAGGVRPVALDERLPIYEASPVSYEARRALVTRLWAMWMVSCWLPIAALLGVFIASNQRRVSERLDGADQREAAA